MPFDLRQPRLTRAERDAARNRLAKMRGEEMAAALARITRDALEDGRVPSPFAYEALFRAVLRSVLVLQGWRWTPADAAAAAVVRISLELLRVERPSWAEGQPDWAISSGDLIERTRCANCHKPLLEGRPKFCSTPCRNAYHLRLLRMREADEHKAARMAARVEL